jgi:hypothetical protein
MKFDRARTPELLERQKLPKPLVGRISGSSDLTTFAFERHLARNGTHSQFFLHVSGRQRSDFSIALMNRQNAGSFHGDVEAKFWDKYQEAYET